MKKLILMAAALCMTLTACATTTTASKKDPKEALGALLGGGSGRDSGSGSTLGNAIGGLVSGLLSTDKVTVDKMVGIWNYTSPAVCFKSENFLQQAGGSAAAGAIEGKLEPYYNTLGLNRMVLTVKEDSTFEMNTGKLRLKGTVAADGNGDVIFNFAAGKIPLGKMKAYINLSAGGKMSLMFDVKKLVTIMKAVGSVTGLSTVNTITGILDSYDGVCAGFKLQKAK